MMNLFVTLLLISGGIASSDVCNEPQACKPREHIEFPETEEELRKICPFAIEFQECKHQYYEICYPHSEALEYTSSFLEIIREICSEDTLLHSAIVDNLKCFKKLLDDETTLSNCDTEPNRLEGIVEALIEEGIVTLTDNVNDTTKLYQCIEMADFNACVSSIVKRRCGNVAMNAFIKISQKIGPVSSRECYDLPDIFPALMRLNSVEEEKENSIAESFRKRK